MHTLAPCTHTQYNRKLKQKNLKLNEDCLASVFSPTGEVIAGLISIILFGALLGGTWDNVGGSGTVAGLWMIVMLMMIMKNVCFWAKRSSSFSLRDYGGDP